MLRIDQLLVEFSSIRGTRIRIRYVLQLIGGEHLFFALGRGNILFHTPNVAFNCTDFLARAGLVVRQDGKTWVFPPSRQRGHSS
jgi:hypothetical protein